MNVKEIIEQHLKDNGFDGLYSEEDCACKIDDLFPCEENPCDCKPGHLLPCDSKTCGEHDWHIGEKK